MKKTVDIWSAARQGMLAWLMAVALACAVFPSWAEAAQGQARPLDAVGRGDTLAISIFGQPQWNAQVTVGGDGQIVAPLLGPIAVEGLPPSEIGRRISAGLRSGGYLQDPQVGVEVVRVRSRMVSLLGEVARPGRYTLEEELTLLDLLSEAGGLRDMAADTVTVLRDDPKGGEPLRIELFVGNRLAPSGEVQNTRLQPGDIVFVPHAQQVYVHGEVVRGGAYPLEQGLNVMRALALAGGITPRGSENRITLHRTDAATGSVAEHRAKLTDPLQPGDVIHVDERIF